ncbi:MAG: PAS domain S-box protein [Acidobacteria bacterium]|nr:PAS domain S-box protein [Acidobacteriota bacterium]MBI3487101.1 PAS domain S-box protein [Acidobacteriota bacterium]
MSHARSLQLRALAAALPAFLAAGLAFTPLPRWAVVMGLCAALAVSWWRIRELGSAAERPLQTLSNLLAAIREGDFSFRARTPTTEDALGDVFRELNILSELLQQQRAKAMEATALLRSVMEEIDVAVFAFDEGGRLRLVNRAGEAFLGQSHGQLLGLPAVELGLGGALADEGPRLLDLALPGRVGRFELRRSAFRQAGRPHQLLVLSDLTRPLREEERQAWQRLIRVLGHEINNSLAPIQSLSGSIATLLERQGPEWKEDAAQGLAIIEARAQALGRFMESYTRLARLPEPRLGPVDAGPLVRKLAALEARLSVAVEPGPDLVFQGDSDQLEQALINLLRNAVDAALETGGGVRMAWRTSGDWAEFLVEDEGPGLPHSGNLFVPFFTTKPGGSGIGLVLARQIAEGHRGSLHLANGPSRGACAVLRLPLRS